MMKPQRSGIIEQITKLYGSKLQSNIKLAFDIFEKQNWTLAEIIKFVIENHKLDEIDTRIKIIDSRKFTIGSIDFHFNAYEDWEAPDTTTYYELKLLLSLKDIDNNRIKFTEIKGLQNEETFDPFFAIESNKDKFSFTTKMDECTNTILANLDLNKTENLYNYIHNYFSKLIDQIDNEEIMFCK